MGLFLSQSRLIAKVDIIRTSGPSAQVRHRASFVTEQGTSTPKAFFSLFFFDSYTQADHFLKHTSYLNFGKHVLLLITKKILLVFLAPLVVQRQV